MMVPPPNSEAVEKHREEAEDYEMFAPGLEGERYGRILATATVLAFGTVALVAEGAMGAIM